MTHRDLDAEEREKMNKSFLYSMSVLGGIIWLMMKGDFATAYVRAVRVKKTIS